MIGSFVVHVGLLLVGAQSVPALAPTSERHEIAPTPMVYLRLYGDERGESWSQGPGALADGPREDGAEPPSRCCDMGSMGSIEAVEGAGRYAVQGPPDNPDPHLARVGGRGWAWEWLGPRTEPAGADPDAPTAPWGRDDALGSDHRSARGAMWGKAIAPATGDGGLGDGGGRAEEPEDEPVGVSRVAAPSYERHRHRGYQQDALRGWD